GAHPGRRVHHSRRSTERHRRADEDVSDPARREQPNLRHRRQDADRLAQAGRFWIGPDRADTAGYRRHCFLLPLRVGRRTAPNRPGDHPGLRRGSERLMVEFVRIRWPVVQRSLLAWAAYHAVRWAPVVVVALLAFYAFPLPTHLATPQLRIGDTAPQTV